MSNRPGDIDFSRSYLFFRTTRVNHTPRLRLDAACTLTRDGRQRHFFLTCPCIGEAMYVERDLIHDPVAEFNIIAAPRDQFLMMKRHADAVHDVHSAHRFGETMPTHDGRGAQVVDLDVKLSRYAAVHPIQDYGEFRAALLNGLPINGRTSYTEPDGTEVVLDYPANTVNVAHDKTSWQVDAGPIVMPTIAKDEAGKLEVERLVLAYLVYNRQDYVEAVIRCPAPMGDATTNFYHQHHNLDCHNELFVCH